MTCQLYGSHGIAAEVPWKVTSCTNFSGRIQIRPLAQNITHPSQVAQDPRLTNPTLTLEQVAANRIGSSGQPVVQRNAGSHAEQIVDSPSGTARGAGQSALMQRPGDPALVVLAVCGIDGPAPITREAPPARRASRPGAPRRGSGPRRPPASQRRGASSGPLGGFTAGAA